MIGHLLPEGGVRIVELVRLVEVKQGIEIPDQRPEIIVGAEVSCVYSSAKPVLEIRMVSKVSIARGLRMAFPLILKPS